MAKKPSRTGSIDIEFGIPEADQESGFMNATLQDLNERTAVSISLRLPEHLAIDTKDEAAMTTFFEDMFQPLVDLGFEIEMQVGPKDGFEDDEQQDEENTGEFAVD